MDIVSFILVLFFMEFIYDVVFGVILLLVFKFDGVVVDLVDFVFGLVSGLAGEICVLLIVLGGIYFIVCNMMNWCILVFILLMVYVFSGIMYWVDVEVYFLLVFMLFFGGLMLGVVFMAIDMVVFLFIVKGVVVYGVLIGLLVVVIWFWGGLLEGVMYVILLVNVVLFYIDSVL